MQGSVRSNRPKTGARRDLQQERFAAYFPRVFAYACAATGDEEAARDVVVASFSDVYLLPDMRGDEFELALFGNARELCLSPEFRLKRPDDGLGTRERDVISLVFDAQLSKTQVAALTGVPEETVATILLRGLRKLRSRTSTGSVGNIAPSFS